MTTPTNHALAAVFDEIADLLELSDESPHRVRSYRQTADLVRDYPQDMRALAQAGTLTRLPRVGDVLAAKIQEFLDTGALDLLDRLRAEVPAGVVALKRINGVGPKTAARLWRELGITTLADAALAARDGLIRALPRMGAKLEQTILAGVTTLAATSGQMLLAEARPAADALAEALAGLPGVARASVVGEVRRGLPLVREIGVLAAIDDAGALVLVLGGLPTVQAVQADGTGAARVTLASGVVVTVYTVTPAQWGTALVAHSSSDAHIRQLEARAPSGVLPAATTEDGLYNALGLPDIPVELREGTGEIEAAQNGALPTLITLGDLRGDLHMHTTWSDGRASVREMAEAARARGRDYVVITDHSGSLAVANGLGPERLLAQQREVRAVDEAMRPFRVFHGVEMDILPDGTLDTPDAVLAQLDFVIASLHVGLRQDRATVTQRALNAIANPHVDMLAHARGRLLPDRPGADLDMDAVIVAAARYGVVLEINSNPRRLDIDGDLARQALAAGVLLAVNSDAHAPDQMDLLPYGVTTARRAAATPAQVLNTRTADAFLEWLGTRTTREAAS